MDRRTACRRCTLHSPTAIVEVHSCAQFYIARCRCASIGKALLEVTNVVKFKIGCGEKSLSDGSRQLHSNLPRVGRSDSLICTGADVHKQPKTHAKPKSVYGIKRPQEKERNQRRDLILERQSWVRGKQDVGAECAGILQGLGLATKK